MRHSNRESKLRRGESGSNLHNRSQRSRLMHAFVRNYRFSSEVSRRKLEISSEVVYFRSGCFKGGVYVISGHDRLSD